MLHFTYALFPYDKARKALLFYIKGTQNGSHCNLREDIDMTFFQLNKQLLKCKLVVTENTPTSSDRHVVLPMCGTIWTPSRQPFTSYWQIKTHQMLIINATFSFFQLPIFTPSCRSFGINITGMYECRVADPNCFRSHYQSTTVFCGIKWPFSISTSD